MKIIHCRHGFSDWAAPPEGIYCQRPEIYRRHLPELPEQFSVDIESIDEVKCYFVFWNLSTINQYIINNYDDLPNPDITFHADTNWLLQSSFLSQWDQIVFMRTSFSKRFPFELFCLKFPYIWLQLWTTARIFIKSKNEFPRETVQGV